MYLSCSHPLSVVRSIGLRHSRCVRFTDFPSQPSSLGCPFPYPAILTRRLSLYSSRPVLLAVFLSLRRLSGASSPLVFCRASLFDPLACWAFHLAQTGEPFPPRGCVRSSHRIKVPYSHQQKCTTVYNSDFLPYSNLRYVLSGTLALTVFPIPSMRAKTSSLIFSRRASASSNQRPKVSKLRGLPAPVTDDIMQGAH